MTLEGRKNVWMWKSGDDSISSLNCSSDDDASGSGWREVLYLSPGHAESVEI